MFPSNLNASLFTCVPAFASELCRNIQFVTVVVSSDMTMTVARPLASKVHNGKFFFFEIVDN